MKKIAIKNFQKVVALFFHGDILSRMRKKFSMEQRIKNLKKGESFIVSTVAERQNIRRIAMSLERLGMIETKIVTRANGGKFIVAAI